jgi:hypothetical protein
MRKIREVLLVADIVASSCRWRHDRTNQSFKHVRRIDPLAFGVLNSGCCARQPARYSGSPEFRPGPASGPPIEASALSSASKHLPDNSHDHVPKVHHPKANNPCRQHRKPNEGNIFQCRYSPALARSARSSRLRSAVLVKPSPTGRLRRGLARGMSPNFQGKYPTPQAQEGQQRPR